tara:strand:+ start:344 stop:736 length:393 start_codon:yes stop_codon:yes gene_type:complete
MAPHTIVEALFDQATVALHDALSDLAAASKGPLTVRTLSEHHDAVLVDINDQHRHLRHINRFQLAYAKETIGNRDADGVNASDRRQPTTVTAYAGTLHQKRYAATFENRDPLEVYEWMLRTVVTTGGLTI